MNQEARVVLAGRSTPLVLRDLGPRLTGADVARFEAELGHTLPAAYREFLLVYNGGDPVSGEVLGRDDEPDVSYRHGDSVEHFLKLPSATESVADYERLETPDEHVWALPGDVLPIAEDAFGNAFVLELGSRGTAVRFVDHEQLDAPLHDHRVLADDFLDFTLRFASVEAMRAEEEAERLAARRRVVEAAFPAPLEAQCELVRAEFPDIGVWIRALFLRLFDAKGYLAIHEDQLSRTALDVVAWLRFRARGLALRSPDEALAAMTEMLLRRSSDGFGLTGYAPAFIESWWADRLARGLLQPGPEGFVPSVPATQALLEALRDGGKLR